MTPAGVVPAHPYTLHGNAVAAFALVRKRAGEWHVDPARIGMVGFSAGAMLTMATKGAAAVEPYVASYLPALVTAGVAVVEFAPATGSLEHTFLDLGNGQSAAASPPGPEPTSHDPSAPDANPEATS